MGRTAGSLLAAAGLVAAMGGMFVPSNPITSAASAKTRTASQNEIPRLPADSGDGRRVVFDQSDQRVWLVAADGAIERSYLVIGSNRGNVRAGSYRVTSRTEFARAYDGSGTFELFVRFTEGRTAPIGFHTVTVTRQGELAYSRDDLGTPRTPGCVEAWRDDAEALWDFAPVGTEVVVTA